MTKVKVSPKDEFLLPRAVMDAHGFADGAEIEVSGSGNQIVLKLVQERPRPAGTLTVEEFIERLPRIKAPYIDDEVINEAIEKEARRMWDEENNR